MEVPERSVIGGLILGLIAATFPVTGKGEECVPRDFGFGSIVCVCNSTYCDSAARKVPGRGQYRIYESSRDGKRMSQTIGRFEADTVNENSVNAITIMINDKERYQTIDGFGGAFTDSAGINIMNLSSGTQDMLLETYFGTNGSRYNLCRLPIGGTDFSTRAYSYCDTKDETLSNFSLAMEDYVYKIPLMRKAVEINPNLEFISSAWSAPAWMKTNNALFGFGFLKKQYFQTYANYLLKFLTEYKKHGFKIRAITTGNEPMNVLYTASMINSMGWLPHDVANWLADNLGPTIARSESNETLILIIDDQRINVPWYAERIFRNSRAKHYTAGIALHWYWDTLVGPDVLDATHHLFPTKFLIQTEACRGNQPWDYPKVRLGDWERGAAYISDIIESLNHWMTGWLDWNLALDRIGGPNWIENYVDSPIIVNHETDEFFKQPTYYALAHFSKFITRGSTRIGTATIGGDLKKVALLTPDNEIVLVLLNQKKKKMRIVVKDPRRGSFSTDLLPRSVQTIVYRK